MMKKKNEISSIFSRFLRTIFFFNENVNVKPQAHTHTHTQGSRSTRTQINSPEIVHPVHSPRVNAHAWGIRWIYTCPQTFTYGSYKDAAIFPLLHATLNLPNSWQAWGSLETCTAHYTNHCPGWRSDKLESMYGEKKPCESESAHQILQN